MVDDSVVIVEALFSLFLSICIIALCTKYKKLNEKYYQDIVKDWIFVKIIFQSNLNKIYTSGNLYSVKVMDNEYILADVVDIEKAIFDEQVLKDKIDTVNEMYKPKVVFVNRASPNTWSWKIHSSEYSHIFKYYMVMSELNPTNIIAYNKIFSLVEEFDTKHNHKICYIDVSSN